jgi:hypothetical protein
MSVTRSQPSWNAATVSMPLVGNHPSLSEKRLMNMRPTQKSGVA